MMGWKILFTIFFVTLGPVKLVVPFAILTEHATPALRREIALRCFGRTSSGGSLRGHLSSISLCVLWKFPTIDYRAGCLHGGTRCG